MSYFAVTGRHAEHGQVIVIESNEAASLDTMQAFAKLGYKMLRRFRTTSRAFAAYSNGETLSTDVAVRDGKAFPVIVIG